MNHLVRTDKQRSTGTSAIRSVVVLVAAFVLLAACGSSSGSGDSGKDTFRVGVIGNFSGSDPQSSKDMLTGAEMAVADLNAEGARKLKLVTADGAFTTKDSVDAIHRLIDVEKVEAIVMYGGSDILLAVAPYAKAKNVLIINSASTSAELTNYPGTLFNVLPTDTQMVAILADQAAKANATDIALVYPNNTFGAGFGTAAKSALKGTGGKVVATVAYKEGAASYRSTLQTVKDANPDAILSAGYGADSRTIFKEARLIGLESPWYLLYPTIFVPEDPKWLDGRAFGVDIAAQSLTEAGALKARYEKENKGSPQPVTFYAYDAIQVLAESATKSNSTKADDLRKALFSTKFKGISGEVEFAKDGSRVSAPHDLLVFKDGAFTQLNGDE